MSFGKLDVSFGKLDVGAGEPVGFVFTHVSAAVRVTVPTLALKMISRVRCVEPNEYRTGNAAAPFARS